MLADESRERFRALALPLLPNMHRLALALTGNRSCAENLVQETYLRALKYFGSYQGEDFRAWMAAIMRNLHRGQGPTPMSTNDEDSLAALPDPSPGPEQVLLAADQAERLRRLIAALPEGLREVLVMREFGDLSYAQIAAILAVPAGTVMSRLARARENLRKSWLTANDGYNS
jgi:RNA polymerase sigma-70 factor (ECF subfamily)